ncbi:MAG: hypothetical protein RLO17_02560 [Cyclobacteriaceae bacterium]
MKRTSRYIIYFVIGIAIYYGLEADKNPDALKEVHKIAPIAILIIFGALILVRYIRTKKGE